MRNYDKNIENKWLIYTVITHGSKQMDVLRMFYSCIRGMIY